MKKYFISFGNKNFKHQLGRICDEAKEIGWFNEVIGYTPSKISNFIDSHKEFFNKNPRGFGYWIWKPYIILEQLSKINDDEYVLYTDAGSKIFPHRKAKFEDNLRMLNEKLDLIISEGPAYVARGGYTTKTSTQLYLLTKFI